MSKTQSEELVANGAIRLVGEGTADEDTILVAIGGYQLAEMRKASKRLQSCNIPHSLVYVLEPGRFRTVRDTWEAAGAVAQGVAEDLFPTSAQHRVFLCHTRPEPMTGVLRPLVTGSGKTKVLGFINRGGTLDTDGMLFANKCTWAHVLEAVADLQDLKLSEVLSGQEIAAVHGEIRPKGILF